MKHAKQEQGYALITVMLIITVFTILGFTFTAMAFNSVKQTQTVEKTSQSVALAEMGVSYLDVAIQEIFKNTKIDIEGKVARRELTSVPQVINYMKASLKNGIKNITPETIDTNSSYSIIKDDAKIDIISIGNLLKIKVYVTGTKVNPNSTEDAVSTLFVEMAIDNLNDINIITADDASTPEITFGKVTRPDVEVAAECTNPSSFANIGQSNGNNGNGNNGNSNNNIVCADVIIDQPVGGIKTYDGNNDVNVNKVYSTVGLNFTGNLNNRAGLEMYAISLQIGSNFNNPKDVVVETKHNLSIGSNVQNTDHTSFYVGGLLDINGHLDLENSSKVFIRGTRTPTEMTNKIVSNINGNLNILSGSRMCVNGDLKVKDALNIPQQYGLIIKGKVYNFSGGVKEHSNIYYVTEATDKDWLKTMCGNTFDEKSPLNSIEWGDLTNAVLNDVTYE
jgi:Tfp pilus assembly protein PilX